MCREELLPMADIVMPNIPEAAAILGWGKTAIRNVEDMRRAAEHICKLGPR